MKKLITFTLLAAASSGVLAGLFGSSNYEECISDGTSKDSSPLRYQIVKSECERKFPKLPSIYKKKNRIELSCYDPSVKKTASVLIEKGGLNFANNPELKMSELVNDQSALSGKWYESDEKIWFDVSGTLNAKNGKLTLDLSSKTPKKNWVYEMDCNEK